RAVLAGEPDHGAALALRPRVEAEVALFLRQPELERAAGVIEDAGACDAVGMDAEHAPGHLQPEAHGERRPGDDRHLDDRAVPTLLKDPAARNDPRLAGLDPSFLAGDRIAEDRVSQWSRRIAVDVLGGDARGIEHGHDIERVLD